jgi:hypothetical protein
MPRFSELRSDMTNPEKGIVVMGTVVPTGIYSAKFADIREDDRVAYVPFEQRDASGNPTGVMRKLPVSAMDLTDKNTKKVFKSVNVAVNSIMLATSSVNGFEKGTYTVEAKEQLRRGSQDKVIRTEFVGEDLEEIEPKPSKVK